VRQLHLGAVLGDELDNVDEIQDRVTQFINLPFLPRIDATQNPAIVSGLRDGDASVVSG